MFKIIYYIFQKFTFLPDKSIVSSSKMKVTTSHIETGIISNMMLGMVYLLVLLINLKFLIVILYLYIKLSTLYVVDFCNLIFRIIFR